MKDTNEPVAIVAGGIVVVIVMGTLLAAFLIPSG